MATVRCPKCRNTSGGDWSQCGKDCPMPMSPYFNSEHERVEEAKRILEQVQ